MYFLDKLYYICQDLLPLFGLIVLVVLIITLIKLSIFLGKAGKVLDKSHNSLDLVEKTLDKAQVPVDTLVKVSKGVDKAYDKSVETIDEAKHYVKKNATAIKNKISSILKKENNDKNSVEESEYLQDEDFLVSTPKNTTKQTEIKVEEDIKPIKETPIVEENLSNNKHIEELSDVKDSEIKPIEETEIEILEEE